jgi:uncharacterized membrane protein
MTASAKAKKGSVTGWTLFLATLLVLSFAAMPGYEAYSVVADRMLIAIRLSLVLALSVLVLRERFSNTEGAHSTDSFMQRFRRWYYDE